MRVHLPGESEGKVCQAPRGYLPPRHVLLPLLQGRPGEPEGVLAAQSGEGEPSQAEAELSEEEKVRGCGDHGDLMGGKY